MSSTENNGAHDDSVICLDTSDVAASSDNENNKRVSENIRFDETLPPGVAPDGFIILDETCDTEKTNLPEDRCKNDEEASDTAEPMFTIIFRDEQISSRYKRRLKDFLRKLVPLGSKIEDSESSSLVLEVWNKEKLNETSHNNLTSKNVQNSKKSEDDIDISALFTIEKKPMFQDELDVPTYGKKFIQVMDSMSETKKVEEKAEKASCRPKITCFNCMGNHSIRDCSEPRNYMEIAKNRNDFAARTGGQKPGRYHAESDEQKFSRFVPGQLSRDLKRALGVNDNQLPPFIYRMRMLGYPPGWLKEARLQHSGMNLYNSDGLLVRDPRDEPGEIVEFGDRDLYDIRKIQDFPGFNVEPPAGTKEEDKKYWKSYQYTVNSKESLLAMMSGKKVDGYRRKKFKRDDELLDDSANTPADMDVEESMDENVVENVSSNGFFIPPLPKNSPRPPLPPEPEEGEIDSTAGENSNEAIQSPGHVDSPSLADLERRKHQLLAELDNSGASPPVTPVSSRSCNKKMANEKKAGLEDEDNCQTVEAMCSLSTPSRGAIKSVDFGTPILESTSPYSKLPAVENFSKDICDVINFENLPDSTGKYEQMSGLLQKVRSTLATNQQE